MILVEPPRAFVANAIRPGAGGYRRDAGSNGAARRAAAVFDDVWQPRRVFRFHELCEAGAGGLRGLVSQLRNGDSAGRAGEIARRQVGAVKLRGGARRVGLPGLNTLAARRM